MDENQKQELQKELDVALSEVQHYKNLAEENRVLCLKETENLANIIGQRNRLQEELQQITDQLENRIAKRTADLEMENEKLKAEMVERRKVEDQIHSLVEELESRIITGNRELEDTNKALQYSLHTLQQTQAQLIESEKHAVLGNLVSGIAHELNTPLGTGITIASFITEKAEQVLNHYKENTMTRSEFESFISSMYDSAASILKNLERMAHLVKSFKQITADHYQGQKSVFKLKQLIENIAITLLPMYKECSCQVVINCDGDFELDSYPGTFSQVITNLIVHSLNHNMDGITSGTITFDITKEQGNLHFLYSDTGKSMADEESRGLFNPFHNTRSGSTGVSELGMHIVYNLITRSLNGTIYHLTRNAGNAFLIQIPIQPLIPDTTVY